MHIFRSNINKKFHVTFGLKFFMFWGLWCLYISHATAEEEYVLERVVPMCSDIQSTEARNQCIFSNATLVIVTEASCPDAEANYDAYTKCYHSTVERTARDFSERGWWPQLYQQHNVGTDPLPGIAAMDCGYLQGIGFSNPDQINRCAASRLPHYQQRAVSLNLDILKPRSTQPDTNRKRNRNTPSESASANKTCSAMPRGFVQTAVVNCSVGAQINMHCLQNGGVIGTVNPDTICACREDSSGNLIQQTCDYYRKP